MAHQALLAALLSFCVTNGAEGAYPFASYYKPFVAQSLWNSKPVNPVFDPTAAVELSDVGYFPAVSQGDYSTGVYLPLATDPPVTVYPLSGLSGVNNVDAYEFLPNITIPRWPADARAAVGDDGHCDIVDVATNRIHSFWKLKKDANNVWRANQYAWAPLNGFGFGDGAHYYQGARAAGVPSCAGIIRKHEAADGAAYFSHALTMSLANKSLASNPSFIYPATSADGNAATTNIGLIPEGALLMLPSTYNTSGIASVNLRKVADTLKVYGAYVVDRNTQTPFVIYVENGANFSLSSLPWDNAVAAELQRIRGALRMVKSAESWLDGNGNLLNFPTKINLLSMRGPSSWYRISGDANVRFDTWTQALVYDGSNTQETKHQNEGGLGSNQFSWAKLQANKQYRFTVEASTGIKLQLIIRNSANVQTNTSGLLVNGEGWTFDYASGSKLVLLAMKPAGGPGNVRGNLVFNSDAVVPYRGNNSQFDVVPSAAPTKAPTAAPTKAPTTAPTTTKAPTKAPSTATAATTPDSLDAPVTTLSTASSAAIISSFSFSCIIVYLLCIL